MPYDFAELVMKRPDWWSPKRGHSQDGRTNIEAFWSLREWSRRVRESIETKLLLSEGQATIATF
jgi:hypothetical protein